MTNLAGETVNTYRYGPYGEAEDTVEGITQPFQYAGGYHDEATGWTKFGVRYIDPELGRWTTQDPLRQLLQPVDANRYTYASNNPINLVDLNGMHPHPEPSGRTERIENLRSDYRECGARALTAGVASGLATGLIGTPGAGLLVFGVVTTVTFVGCTAVANVRNTP